MWKARSYFWLKGCNGQLNKKVELNAAGSCFEKVKENQLYSVCEIMSEKIVFLRRQCNELTIMNFHAVLSKSLWILSNVCLMKGKTMINKGPSQTKWIWSYRKTTIKDRSNALYCFHTQMFKSAFNIKTIISWFRLHTVNFLHLVLTFMTFMTLQQLFLFKKK